MTLLVLLLIILVITCAAISLSIFVGYNYLRELKHTKALLFTARKESEKLAAENQLLQTKLQNETEDAITHLLSWKLFSDRLNQSIKDCERNNGHIAILYVDIDNFKSINSAYDYEVGNQLLSTAAERLKTCLRQVDSISRFNKDTFVILLTQLTKPELAAIVAQRILQAFLEPIMVKDQEQHLTLSIGISLYPIDGKTDLVLLKNAEQALNLAKKRGGHLYQFYQAEMYIRSQRETTLSTSFNNPAICNEFVLNYQPAINVSNQNIVFMDVQFCCDHPTLGLIPFNDLIPSIDHQRKLSMVIDWVITTACKQYLHWRSLGFETGLLGISLPIKALENNRIIYRITQLLQSLNFKPEWMLLQLVANQESLSFEALDKSFNILRYVGMRIAVSEFGTGNISFKQLKFFPVDYIILSKDLIDDIQLNPRSTTLAKAIIQLGNNLGVQVVAQGVETREQVTILQESGCLLMQGRIIAEPMTAKEVDNRMKVQAIT